MPTNLPPDYYHIERQYREATTPQERAELLEQMLSVIPKHKGTEHLRGDLKQKLAKLKTSAEKAAPTGRRASAYHIEREGAGQVVLVGPTNVGKSALVAALTHATPEVADYAFTTWVPTPGMVTFENVQIQLVDTPSVSRERDEPELYHLLRGADLILVMVDMQALTIEQLEETLALLAEHRIVPASGPPPQDERGLVAKPLLVAVNKVDDERLDLDYAVLVDLLESRWPLLPISVAGERGLDGLKRALFEGLGVIRVYAKPPGKQPDLTTPFVLKRGGTVEDFAGKVHRDFLVSLKSARVWGSAQFAGQAVAREHVLQDGDVIELHT
jgi:uncharacterized protein